MPHDTEQLKKLRNDIKSLEDKEESASRQVKITRAKLETLVLFRDTEHNYRYLKIEAANILCMWIRCNPTTCIRGRLSFSWDLTGVDESMPFSEIKFSPFFDPDQRPGGLVSESYARYHGW